MVAFTWSHFGVMLPIALLAALGVLAAVGAASISGGGLHQWPPRRSCAEVGEARVALEGCRCVAAVQSALAPRPRNRSPQLARNVDLPKASTLVSSSAPGVAPPQAPSLPQLLLCPRLSRCFWWLSCCCALIRLMADKGSPWFARMMSESFINRPCRIERGFFFKTNSYFYLYKYFYIE